MAVRRCKKIDLKRIAKATGGEYACCWYTELVLGQFLKQKTAFFLQDHSEPKLQFSDGFIIIKCDIYSKQGYNQERQ